MDINLLSHTFNYIELLYLAGRGCYGLKQVESDIGIIEKFNFIKRLINNQHESVLEHAKITIQIIGCSRSFMAQITRHRLASYSVKSQHYVDHSDFEVKDLESDIEEVQILYKDVIQIIRNRYNQLVNEYKIPIHVAREILPNACLTNIIMTANFREWRYIIKLRQTSNNTIEMKIFANRLLEMFKRLVPGIFDDL